MIESRRVATVGKWDVVGAFAFTQMYDFVLSVHSIEQYYISTSVLTNFEMNMRVRKLKKSQQAQG